MSEFYVTIIHRPEMVPEYIQKEAEQGKKEDITRRGAAGIAGYIPYPAANRT